MGKLIIYLIIVQSLSPVRPFATPWTVACQALLSFTVLEFPQTHVHQVGDAIQPSHPLLLPFLLPSIFPSIRIFSNKLTLRIRWPEYWSFSISPSNEYSGPISFRIDWLDLFAVQEILKSLLQRHSSKASILQCSAFCDSILTSIHDYWKNHSFDYTDICQPK